MKIVDLNVLLYTVNESSAQHEAIYEWWLEAIEGDESIGLPWVVLLGFLRLSTNPRVFPRPLPYQAALEKIESWLSLPVVHVPKEKDDHWVVLAGLLQDAGTAGNLVTDAHLAALSITRDALLVSCDNDFARFSGLRYLNPLR
jgi:toxin-antitoxin system PIN domain toxin